MQQNSWLTMAMVSDLYHFLSVKNEIKAFYKSVKWQLFPKIVHACSVQMCRMQAYQNFEIY